MPASKSLITFVSRPTCEEVELFDRRARARKFAKRPGRRSRLLPFLESIALCLEQGRSYQGISDFLEAIHGHKTDRSTVLRFVRKNPLLSARRACDQ
jgi:hypothetical protein